MKNDRKALGKPVSTDLKIDSKNNRSTSKLSHKRPPIECDQIPIGIAESSLQGKYIDANEEFCQIVGYDKEQLLALGIQNIIFEEDYPVVNTLYTQLVEGKIPFYELEKRYVRKDGTIIWVEAKRSIVRNSRGKALHTIGAILDVSERKRNEERLREQLENRVRDRTVELQVTNEALRKEIVERIQAEDLLRSWAHIFEHAEWGIATVFKDTFVMVNPTFAKMHGYAVGE